HLALPPHPHGDLLDAVTLCGSAAIEHDPHDRPTLAIPTHLARRRIGAERERAAHVGRSRTFGFVFFAERSELIDECLRRDAGVGVVEHHGLGIAWRLCSAGAAGPRGDDPRAGELPLARSARRHQKRKRYDAFTKAEPHEPAILPYEYRKVNQASLARLFFSLKICKRLRHRPWRSRRESPSRTLGPTSKKRS